MKKKDGFLLLEILIVMIVSLVIMGAMWNITNMRNISYKNDITRDRIYYINNAIKNYIINNGYLPCPMISSVSYDDDDYGIESKCRNINTPAELVKSGTGNELVFHGTVPFITLGISERYVYDSWNKRIDYVVVAKLTKSSSDFFDYKTKTNNGVISVIDKDKNNILNKENQDVNAYLLLSGGKSGLGSYDVSGDRIPCKNLTMDNENCNDDSIFLVTDFNYKTKILKSDDYNNAYYDDIVSWSELRDLRTMFFKKKFSENESQDARYFQVLGIKKYSSGKISDKNGLYLINNAQSSIINTDKIIPDGVILNSDFAIMQLKEGTLSFVVSLRKNDVIMVFDAGYFTVIDEKTINFDLDANIVHKISKDDSVKPCFYIDQGKILYKSLANTSYPVKEKNSIFIMDNINHDFIKYDNTTKIITDNTGKVILN